MKILISRLQVSCALLAKISRHLDFGKTANDNVANAFGGVNIVIFGDFHQIPPLGGTPLYMPPLATRSSKPTDAYVGHEIYRQFTTAVELTQQMRVEDQVWQEVLTQMRYANCTPRDFAIIRSLTLQVRHK